MEKFIKYSVNTYDNGEYVLLGHYINEQGIDIAEAIAVSTKEDCVYLYERITGNKYE